MREIMGGKRERERERERESTSHVFIKRGLNIPIFAQCFFYHTSINTCVNTRHLCYHNDCNCVVAQLSLLVIISGPPSNDSSKRINDIVKDLPSGTKLVAVDVGKLTHLHEPCSTLKVPHFDNTPVMFCRMPKSLYCFKRH